LLDSPRSTLEALDGLFADPPTAEKHLRRDCELAPCPHSAGGVGPAPPAVSLPAIRRHLIGGQTPPSVRLVPAHPMTVEELEAGEVGAAGGALVERVQRILLRLSGVDRPKTSRSLRVRSSDAKKRNGVQWWAHRRGPPPGGLSPPGSTSTCAGGWRLLFAISGRRGATPTCGVLARLGQIGSNLTHA
jgi:hypothetical protein